MIADADAVAAALYALGRTPDAVADRLYQSHSTGSPQSPADCPVVVYLRNRFPGWDFALFGSLVMFGHGDSEQNDGTSVPMAVQRFVQLFDCGNYLELDTDAVLSDDGGVLTAG